MQFRRINLHVFQRNRATEDEVLGVICMSYIQLFVYLFLSILSASYDQEFVHSRRKNIPTDDELAGASSMLKNTVDVDPRRGQFPINLDLFSFDPGATTME